MAISEREYADKLLEFTQNVPDFKNWDQVKRLESCAVKYATFKKKSGFKRFISVSFIGVLAYLCYVFGVADYLANSDCLVPGWEPILDMWRPPIADCGYCQIKDIDKRINLTDEEFYEKYAYSGLPLLVVDGMKDWNTEIFGFDYFKRLYENTSPEDNKDCQFFRYRTDFDSLEDVFDMAPDRAQFKPGHEPWYIGWSNCVPSVSQALRKHYKVPYFLGQSERTRDDWMFMGSPGYRGAPLHIDYVDYNSWQAQIRGRKKWTFVPPPECWRECPHQLSVIVEPGNIFVFDSNRWFHSTEVLQGEYSLTIGAEYD